MTRYGMVIDLTSCIGCNACTMACKAEHATPSGVFWRKVLEQEVGTYPSARRVFLPVMCNHCAEPPCRDVCPTGATWKRDDGIVLVDYDQCIGCRSCIEACPYDARTFYADETTYFPGHRTPYEEMQQTFPDGVVMKCNFCVERVDEGRQPACVQSCPTQCLYFGDLDDPESTVSRLVAERKARGLLPEKGTDPSVYYFGD
jgi:molybdopterin-containing oxidoreductase family iron-sulfur binding subunit